MAEDAGTFLPSQEPNPILSKQQLAIASRQHLIHYPGISSLDSLLS